MSGYLTLGQLRAEGWKQDLQIGLV
jgi:hypothetical protein